MAGAKVPLTFRIYKGDDLIAEETLSQPVIKVGKLSSSHLRLDDDTVSRMHAVIEVSGPDDISIIDLGSTKGTIVNGQKVNKAKLQDGDMIQLGETRIELSIGAAGEVDDEDPTRVNVQSAEADSSGAADLVASSPRPAPEPAPAPQMPLSAPAPAPAPRAPAPAAVAPPPGMARPAPAPAAYAATMPSAPASTVIGGGAGGSFGMDGVDDVAGARAVEVAAMLEDSVVHVKHVMNPNGGVVTSATYGMFAVGLLALLIGFFAFFKGVGNASFNKKALHVWTEVERKPVHDFRPRRISIGYDWLAFGGMGLGVLLLTGGLVRYRNEKVSPWYRIGTDAECEFPTADAPAPSFPLVAPMGGDFVFNFADTMEGEMIADGQTVSLADLKAQGRAMASPLYPGANQVQIPLKARFRVRSGNSTFMVSSVAQPRRHPVPFLGALDSQMLVYLGATAGVVVLFLALIWSIPPDTSTLALDVLGGEGRLGRVQQTPPEEPKQEETEVEEEDTGDDQSGGTGTKMALEEGKMGKKDSTRQSGQYAMKKNWDGDPQLARQQAMDAARRSGVLGAFSAQPGGAFASITGTGDFSSGLDDRDVYGGLIGNEVGEMQGGWGYGLKGTGPGGGGTGWGTIGTGRYGTIGHGSGTGSGYGVGSGRGGMRGRKARPPEVRIGSATATGDLDKNIIRRYIRKKLPQIKYCYEKQLLVKPKLEGTVTTQFTISGNGAVISVQASGIGDPAVESCVAAAIKSIQFPKPKGGGLVNVRYPFTFRPAGE